MKQSIKKLSKAAFYILLGLIFFAADFSFAEQYTVILKAEKYLINKTDNSQHEISMDNFGTITKCGYPKLPSKTLLIPLPEGVKINDINIIPEFTKSILGTYIIKSTDILFPLNSNNDKMSKILENHKNKKQTIYSKNKYYPESTAEVININYLNTKPVVKIRYTPISYNPITKSLKIVERIHVNIDYSNNTDKMQLSVINNNQNPTNNITTRTSLLIISPKELEKVIEPFIFWKRCMGIKTEYINLEWIEDNYTGKNNAEKTREYLKNIYASENIQNVIFIGDHNTSPIKYFYPDPNNHSYTGCIVSDQYFSNLTCDWDSDGDNHLGEFDEDEIDWLPELNIGRIPWSDSTTVKTILNRIIAYEKNNGSWKNNSLLLGGITNFKNEDFMGYPLKTDGAYLMEELKNNIFNNSNSTTMYEREGIEPSEFTSDFSLNGQNINSSWSSGDYGCITWWSHGSTQAATRKWWQADDGDNVPESGEVRHKAFLHIYNIPNTNTNHPIIFANSCHTGAFSGTSLARKIIKNESTGIIAATGEAWSTVGWNSIDAGGSSTLSYYFWEEYIKNKKSIGEAIKSAKIKYLQNFNDSWYHLNNVYTFNYFGDPTIKISNIQPMYGAVTGNLTTEDSDSDSVNDIEITIREIERTTTTDENGHYSFNYIPEGNYHITILNNKYEKVIEVKTGEITTTSFELTQNTQSLTTMDSTCCVEIQEGEKVVKNIKIKNNGTDNISYRINYDRENSCWLTTELDSTQQTIKPNTTDTLIFQIFTGDLDRGVYKTDVFIYKDTCQTPALTIPVNITIIDTIAPSIINDLNFTQSEDQDSLKLFWTAPGDNKLQGTAEKYEFILSKKPIQISSSHDIQYLKQPPTPLTVKSSEQLTISKNYYQEYPYITIQTWDEAGLYSLSNELFLSVTGININNELTNIAKDFVDQNYPNPFNIETNIEFGLSKPGKVNITIYNERGQLVKHLINNKFMNSGKHIVAWDSTNRFNNIVPSGLYIYQVSTNEQIFAKKMTLLK